jgi:hypothetical protein
MKTKVVFKLFLISFISGISFTISITASAQRLVGYLPSYAGGNAPIGSTIPLSQIQFGKMTDVVFCFLNPDATNTGALQVDRVGSADFDFEMDKFQIVKSKCYPMTDNGPRLWVAVGGASSPFPGARPARLNTVCNAAGTRTTFCTNLVNFAIKHDLYGIDIDWEFPTNATEVGNFAAFVVELRARINASTNTKLKISVAVGGETAGGCPAVGTGTNHMGYFPATGNAMVAATDYFHIMAYDLPSTYNANHSSAADGNTSMTNWNTCRGIPLTKMCIGIPFYGKSNPRGTTTNYNALPAGTWTTDGPTSSVYYNGQPAINAKIDAIRSTSYNGAGVVIWDVSLDKDVSTAQSLLSYTNSKMFGSANVTNPCPPLPYIGKDTTICSTAGITLNSNVAATGGSPTRSFQWYNGNVALGTSPTQAITTAGVYSVKVTQQANPVGTTTPCSVVDTIIVSLQTDAPTPTASVTTVCTSTTASSTLSSGSSVQWYTAAASGAPFATGTSTVVTPAVAANGTVYTYYTQPAGTPTNKKYFGGRGYMDQATAGWNERTANPTMTTRPEWVQKLTVYQPIVLKSVVVNFSSSVAHNPVSIMIMDAGGAGTTLATVPTQVSANQTATVSLAAHPTPEPWTGYPTILTVNITIQPGTYNIGVYNPNGSVSPQYAVLQTAMSFPSNMPNIYSIGSNAWQNSGTGYFGASTHYGQLFDWRIESAAQSNCTRKTVNVTYDCPAPVQLLDFKGNSEGDKNYLSWLTAMEVNNDHFNIEWSSDGINFEVIGTINGQGNSTIGAAYSFVDQNPNNGINYYRLAQYDLDGTSDQSNIISINNDQEIVCQVVPNPFDHNATLVLKNIQGASVDLMDLQGNLLSTYTVANLQSEIKIGEGLSAGVYQVRVNSGEFSRVLKVVKY